MDIIEKFHREHYKRLVNVVSCKVGYDRALAEDIVQESFAKAIKFMPVYDENRGEFKPWFNTILYNTLSDMRRQPIVSMNDSDTISIDDTISSYIAISGADKKIMVNKIDSVSNGKHRNILRFFFMYGYTSKEISTFMPDVSQTMVTTVVSRFKESVGDNRL